MTSTLSSSDKHEGTPTTTAEFIKSKRFHNHVIERCNMKGFHTFLEVEGTISSHDFQLMSNCQTPRDANGKVYEILSNDPSIKKLRVLCKVLRECHPTHDNNKELADLIEEFLNGTSKYKYVFILFQI